MPKFNFQDHDISTGGAAITLAEGVYLESKVDFDDETEVRRIDLDGVPGIEMTLPARAAWTRIRAELAGPTTPKSLLALRVTLKIDPVDANKPLELRAALAVGAEGQERRDLIDHTVRNLPVEGTGIYVIGGLFACPPGAAHLLELRLDMPRKAQSRITVLSLETDWFTGEISAAAAARLATEGVEGLPGFRIDGYGSEIPLAELVAEPCAVAHDAGLSGMRLKGHAVSVPRGDRIALKSDKNRIECPTDRLVDLADGVQLACGFEVSLLDIPFGDKRSDVTLATVGKTDMPYQRETVQSDFLQLLRSTDPRGEAGPEEGFKLIFYPDYTVTNHYQTLMYANMDETSARGGTVEDAIAALEQGARPGSVVFHLHWLNPLLAGARTAMEAETKRRRFQNLLRHFVRLGGIVLWTVHNTVSHDAKFSQVEVQLGQDVADLAHRIHVHSETLLPVLAESYDLPVDKLLIQPHPNYVGVYPDYVTRAAARKRLGLPEDARVILFQGQLRPYKGVEHLARAFAQAAADHPDAHLLIVGKPVHPYTPGTVTRKLQGRTNVRVIEQFVPDAELQWYYRAADWVALPYLNILTSGSLLCAMSFSRPCIAPAIGMIPDVLSDGETGVLYDADDPRGLVDAVTRALDTDAGTLDGMRGAAFAAVRDLTWSKMGAALRQAVRLVASAARTVPITFEDGVRDCQLTGPAFPPARPARTAIVILNYEHIEDVRRLVGTLQASRTQDFDIYVVDNASPSLTMTELAMAFSDIHLLCIPENVGYAAGNNAVLRLIEDIPYEFVWILNPDMVVSPEALDQHVAAAEANPGHSIFGATILQGGSDSKVASAGCYINMSDGLTTGHMFAGESTDILPDAPFEADFITGASVFLRKSALAAIGTMPEDYFLYFEETHWLLSARDKGYPSLVLPDVILGHYKRSEESGLPAKYYYYYYLRNALLFYARVAGGNPATLRDRLEAGFIAAWTKKIAARRPEASDLYRHLADRALADGLAGKAGRTDLHAIEYATGEHTAPPPEDAPLVRVAISEDGVVRGLLAFPGETPDSAQIAVLADGRNVASALCERVVADNMGTLSQWAFEVPLPAKTERGVSIKIDLLLNGRLLEQASRLAYLPPLPAEYRGRIDGISGYVCNGWALNTTDNHETLTVEIVHAGEVVARAVADGFRADLKRSGLSDGCVAFNARMPRRFSDGTGHMLSLRIAETDQVLFERSIVGTKPPSGVHDLMQAPGDMMADLFFFRQVWLGGQALEDIPFGRFCGVSDEVLAARHAARPETELVSIVMPAFNRADTILPALESVRAQTYANWELLVVDDGSTDDTVSVLETFVARTGDDRIRILEMPANGGVSAARNMGLAEAKGTLIAYLDSDNTWLPEFLRTMTGELMAQARPGSVYCGQRIMQVCGTSEARHDELLGVRMGDFHLPLLENRNYIDLNCFMHHRRLYDTLGGFAEEIRRLVDWELILRYARLETPRLVRAPLSNYYFDRADNQITKLESYDSNLQDFIKLSARHRRKPMPGIALRKLEIGLVGDETQTLDALVQRALEVQDSLAAEVQVTLLLCPARGQALPETYELPPGLRVLEAEAAPLSAILRARDAEADLLVLSGRALPRRGWLAHLNAAMAECPEGGLFVSRRMIPGARLRLHANAAPFAHSAFDVCIALRADDRRVLDPAYAPDRNIVELSKGDGFFSYIPADCAAALHAVSDAADDLEAELELVSQIVRVALQRRILYCGDVEVYDL